MAALQDTHDTGELPEDYQPSEYDAIVGWARQNYHHGGNQRLREIIQAHVHDYVFAKSKTEKGVVIATIIAKLRRESPAGVGLVRQNPKTLRWSYIGLEKSKDKIGHALRKASYQYKKKHGLRRNSGQMRVSPSSNSLGALDSTTTTRSNTSSDAEDDDGEAYRYHEVLYDGMAEVAGRHAPRGYYDPPGYFHGHGPEPSPPHSMMHHLEPPVSPEPHHRYYPGYPPSLYHDPTAMHYQPYYHHQHGYHPVAPVESGYPGHQYPPPYHHPPHASSTMAYPEPISSHSRLDPSDLQQKRREFSHHPESVPSYHHHHHMNNSSWDERNPHPHEDAFYNRSSY